MVKENNPIPYKLRLKELFFDYLLIVTYLALLLAVAMTGYLLVSGGLPSRGELASQVIAFLSSVLPLILIFSYLDYSSAGSCGKRKVGLKLVYRKKSFKASLIRNSVKFLPWQVAHMGIIHGTYSEFDALSIILMEASIIGAAVLFFMALFRKDKRHLGDFLAKTQVQMGVE
ncbi:RDD family protein [Rothia sp. P5766]|uniref:RDD family protein n=2 Tax=unclassified Rothia (in: high G+C Gram-positive bacteria) TaxID=2689056 RepID=UPI003AE101A3